MRGLNVKLRMENGECKVRREELGEKERTEDY